MGSHGAEKIVTVGEAEGSETTIEIKIKTLDSQTYTLKVNKQMPVPALKERIASVTGVLSEQQRLICRGKVLKDDQLLSAYHVEDGHTLHLVVRQPVPPSTDNLFNYSGTDLTSGSSRNRVSPNVVIETFSVPDQGEEVPPEIGRIVSAILGSFGFSNISSGNNGIDVRIWTWKEHGSQRLERTSGAGTTTDLSEQQREQISARNQADRLQSAFGLPSAVPLEPLLPPVLPDSLTTLSQYLIRLKQEFNGIFRGEANNPQASMSRDEERDSTSASHPATVQEGLPTPAALAELLLSTRLLLVEQVGDCLTQLARQLVDQVNVTDSAARASIQSSTWRTGLMFHNLGSFLLELGRTTMTARLGQTPTEAVVNAGPAVFVSPSGPNPLMVQPLPLQPGTSFGAIPMGSTQPNSGLINGLGTTFLPRRIDIQIRRGTPNLNREVSGDSQQPSGQRTSAATGSLAQNPGNQTTFGVSESPHAREPGVRVVPIRTVVATIPAPFSRQSTDSTGNNRGLYYPLVGRLRHIPSEDASVNQALGEHLFDGMQTELLPVPEGSVQQQNAEGNATDGSFSNPNSRQQQRPARSISINVLAADGTQTNQETERQIPSSVLHLLRTAFPGGELSTEEASPLQPPTQSAPENVGTPSGATPESSVTEEGIFLSNLLSQILPLISQHNTSGQESAMPQEASASTEVENSNIGTSRRPDDAEMSPPNSKRQKMD